MFDLCPISGKDIFGLKKGKNGDDVFIVLPVSSAEWEIHQGAAHRRLNHGRCPRRTFSSAPGIFFFRHLLDSPKSFPENAARKVQKFEKHRDLVGLCGCGTLCWCSEPHLFQKHGDNSVAHLPFLEICGNPEIESQPKMDFKIRNSLETILWCTSSSSPKSSNHPLLSNLAILSIFTSKIDIYTWSLQFSNPKQLVISGGHRLKTW